LTKHPWIGQGVLSNALTEYPTDVFFEEIL
jgi:hypothetical protein